MASAGLPARDTLRLRGQTIIAWAIFDASWYLAAYPDARSELEAADDKAVLHYYIERGQPQGHAPNIWFDEQWYLQRYPGSAAAVREGQVESAFDDYCRSGYRTRSPHWLFDEVLYRWLHPDLSDEALAHEGSVNGYDHYLRHGAREGRIGHLLFEPSLYAAQLADEERAAADDLTCYQHYLARIAQRRPEIRTSHLFDPVWYVRRYPGASERNWRCALHHYLTNATPTEFDPLPEFSEAHYLQCNADVVAAVEAGDWRNGYDHFLIHGAAEFRSPCAAIDLRYYVAANPTVRGEIDCGRARDAFFHYLAIGRAQELVTSHLSEDRISERQAAALLRRNADTSLPAFARTSFDFSCGEVPAVSVIAILRGAFPLELRMLATLRAGFAGDIDLILIEAGPADDHKRIGRFVLNARVLRLDRDGDLAPVANAALDRASADTILFIDGALELAPSALDAALRRLRSDPRIAVVGGKILRADGRLEAAGGIVWRDGNISGYLNTALPLAPEANFVREVDCFADLLLLRAAALREIDGFDDGFSLDHYAAADLCLRVSDAGYRVAYDPAVVATRLASRFQPNDAGREALLRKHKNRLEVRHAADKRMELFARCRDKGRHVLFIDDLLPLRHLGSGFVRSNDLLQIMASLGYRITVYPINAGKFDLASIYADMPETAEVMHDGCREELLNFLLARQGYYDVIWIVRTHNLDQIKPILERIPADLGNQPRVVLDTEAIAALRDAERAALTDSFGFDFTAAIKREFANAHLCQSFVAVNALEAQMLREQGFSDVAVIGHRRDPQPTPRAFSERAGMLFLAAMHEQESPNRDALDWFVTEVLPLIERSLGWETRLTVAGHAGPGLSFDEYRNFSRITLRGPVEKIFPLYDAHRIVVAPTRYSAGLPYKVHEAASYGVPVVATELLRQQLGWQHKRDLLAANATDPADFAHQVITVYRDPAVWQSLRENALERIREENGRAAYEQAVQHVLEVKH